MFQCPEVLTTANPSSWDLDSTTSTYAFFRLPRPSSCLRPTSSQATLDSPDDLSDAVQPLHDVLVVGAGPHALAVVARLLEDRPSALYTDAEHARLSWLRQYAHSRRAPKGAARTLVRPPARAAAAAAGRPDLVVLDRHARPGWMPQWTTLFETLQIRTLRSPMFFHPCGPPSASARRC
jgi:hypothetical protein